MSRCLPRRLCLGIPLRGRQLLCALFLVGLAAPVRADALSDAQAANMRGEHAAALALAKPLMAAAPRDPQPLFQTGVALMGLGRDAEAMQVFTELTQSYPELPDPWNDIAVLQVRAGRLEAAREALQNALRNDPTHTTARANLGQVHLMLAIDEWTRAAAARPLDRDLARRLDAARAVLGEPPVVPRPAVRPAVRPEARPAALPIVPAATPAATRSAPRAR